MNGVGDPLETVNADSLKVKMPLPSTGAGNIKSKPPTAQNLVEDP